MENNSISVDYLVNVAFRDIMSPLEISRWTSVLHYLSENKLDLRNRELSDRACKSLNLRFKQLEQLIEELQGWDLVDIGNGLSSIEVKITDKGCEFLEIIKDKQSYQC